MTGVSRNEKTITPWGSFAALMAASFATIAGLVRGIDPEVILWRALVAATLVGTLAAVANVIAHRAGPRETRKPE